MRYEGSIYRPPSEAYSLIVQATIGCAHNDCTFCSMFKDKDFRIRKTDDIIDDLHFARKSHRTVGRIFLADGDALILPNDTLLKILSTIETLFPECSRVSAYGSPQDALRKSPDELKELKDAGLEMIYIGAESGSDRVLKNVKKGASAAEITEAIKKIETSGIPASVTFISGLGGKTDWEEHAEASGKMITEAQPSYVGLLTLMVDPIAPISRDIREGSFKLLSPPEVINETIRLLEKTKPERDCIFRSNHASNYLSLKGTLPGDREKMVRQLKAASESAGSLKDERFRML